jgi:HEAT repeat protein
LDQLLISLNNRDLFERMKTDCALIEAKAVETLLGLLDDQNSPNEARWRAAANLGECGDARAVESLLTAMTDASWDVRASAIWALGMLGDTRGFDALCAIVENPIPDEQNSYVAARALIRIDSSRAVDVLKRAANAPNHRVRSWGRSALACLEFET